jgi:hypothetical protein
MIPEAGHLFLSYNQRDRDFVRRLASDLKERGVDVWLDEWRVNVGDSLASRVASGIEKASYLVVILSRASVGSQWVTLELNAALAEELRRKSVFVLPVILDDCEVPLFIRDKMYADFRRSYSDGLQSILRKVLPGEGTPPKLVFDSVRQDPTFSTWAVHCSDGARRALVWNHEDEEDRCTIVFEATRSHSVGINKSVPTLHGRVSYQYRIVASSAPGEHVYFAMIPIQETGYDRQGVIEVGSDVANHPRNPKSPHRIRTFVPRAHQKDGAWHSGTIDFDFRDTATAFYSIFAARVNEGVDLPGDARVEIRHVQIYSW